MKIHFHTAYKDLQSTRAFYFFWSKDTIWGKNSQNLLLFENWIINIQIKHAEDGDLDITYTFSCVQMNGRRVSIIYPSRKYIESK